MVRSSPRSRSGGTVCRACSARYSSAASSSCSARRGAPALRSAFEELDDILVEVLRALDHGPVAAARIHDEAAVGDRAQNLLIAACRTELVLDPPEAQQRAAQLAELRCQVGNRHTRQHILRLCLEDVETLLDQLVGDGLGIVGEQLKKKAQALAIEARTDE